MQRAARSAHVRRRARSTRRRCCAAASSRSTTRRSRQIKAPPEAQWVLNGDRGLTYADDGAAKARRVVAGEWWPKDYDGEPLVSFEAELAAQARPQDRRHASPSTCSAATSRRTIANLREVKWESLALNFVMVFSPNTLARRAAQPAGDRSRCRRHDRSPPRRALAASSAEPIPAVTAIRVKDAIDAFNGVFAKVMTAVRVGRQRDAARRRAGAGRRAGDGAAAAHPRGRHPQDARRHAPAHPDRAFRSNMRCWRRLRRCSPSGSAALAAWVAVTPA